MPKPGPSTTRAFENAKLLGRWLAEHHDSETELWVKIYKKKSGVPTVSWDDVVKECLCWGWIDGLKHALDEQAYLQRVTPRQKRSPWSKRNCQHVEALMAAGRMMPSGIAQVEAAKADGRWDQAYAVSEMEVPEDFLRALDSRPAAKDFFGKLTKSNRFVIAHALSSAKRPETRERRFAKYMQMLERGEKPGG